MRCREMMRRRVCVVAVLLLLGTFTALLLPHAHVQAQENVLDKIFGTVYDSADGLAKIYDENNVWTCKDVVYYCVEEYEAGTLELIVNNGSRDEGSRLTDNSCTFIYHPQEGEWNRSLGEEHVAAGVCAVDSKNYVFLTNFTYEYVEPPRDSPYDRIYLGNCTPTEWVSVPAASVLSSHVYAYLNLAIPKLGNPRADEYGGWTRNAELLDGYVVYRCTEAGLEELGRASECNETHYFFNYTELEHGKRYDYKVAPIARGGYVLGEALSAPLTYPKHLSAAFIEPLTPLGYDISAGSSQTVVLEILQGTPPYNITLSCRNTETLEEIVVGEKLAIWEDTITFDWTPTADWTTVELVAEVSDVYELPIYVLSGEIRVDTVPPAVDVARLSPQPGSTDVRVTASILVYFTEWVRRETVNFSISPAVNITHTFFGQDVIMFVPEMLAPEQTYECKVHAGVTDRSVPGNVMPEAFTWNFTTMPGVACTVVSPFAGTRWSGESAQDIIYKVGGGVPPYTIYINYSAAGEAHALARLEDMPAGLHRYAWETPALTAANVTLTLEVYDVDGIATQTTSAEFALDSTKPYVVRAEPTGKVGLDSVLVIEFSEPMNQTSVEAAFELTPTPEGLTFIWDANGKKVTVRHMGLAEGLHRCTIRDTAKDLSEPGNRLNQTYSWEFEALAGRGDFDVLVEFPEKIVPKKEYTIVVTLKNTGPKSYGVSGELSVVFRVFRVRREERELFWSSTKRVLPQERGAVKIVCSDVVVIPDYGMWEFEVEISSTNPPDIFAGSTGYYLATTSRELTKVEVIRYHYWLAVILIGALLIIAYWAYTKKKPPAEEEAEEEEKVEKEETKGEKEKGQGK